MMLANEKYKLVLIAGGAVVFLATVLLWAQMGSSVFTAMILAGIAMCM